MFAKNLVQNVTETALASAELLLRAGRISEASRWADWGDELDKKSELGRHSPRESLNSRSASQRQRARKVSALKWTKKRTHNNRSPG
jgi:hypothetical protein